MSKHLFNGSNFFVIKNNVIQFWGTNIKEPFEIKINKKIKEYIDKKNFSINEISEFTDDKDYKLYKLCLFFRDDLNSNDGRIMLMNKLVNIGVDKKLATVIALDAGSSQTIVSSEYLSNCDLSENIKEKVISELFNFYMG